MTLRFRLPTVVKGLWIIAAVAGATVGAPDFAEAQPLPRGQILTDDLQSRSVTLQSLSAGGIVYFDAAGELKRESTRRLLRVKFDSAATREQSTSIAADDAPADANTLQPIPADDLGMLLLVDGQRLRGRWVGASEDGQSVRWRHDLLGEVEMPIEQIVAFDLHQTLMDDGRRVRDRIQLANGDVVEGLLESVTDVAMIIRPAGARSSLTLPMERVGRVLLANPVAPALALPVLVLRDGSRLIGQDIGVLDRQANLIEPRLSLTSPDIPLAMVQRIDMAQAAVRLVELTDLPMTVIEGGDVLGLPMAPIQQAGQLQFHAPVHMQWTLPDGAVRVRLVVALDLPEQGSLSSRGWADVTLELQSDGRLLDESHLYDAQPEATFVADVRGLNVSLNVGVGANGPILDRLRFAQALVLIAP